MCRENGGCVVHPENKDSEFSEFLNIVISYGNISFSFVKYIFVLSI